MISRHHFLDLLGFTEHEQTLQCIAAWKAGQAPNFTVSVFSKEIDHCFLVKIVKHTKKNKTFICHFNYQTGTLLPAPQNPSHWFQFDPAITHICQTEEDLHLFLGMLDKYKPHLKRTSLVPLTSLNDLPTPKLDAKEKMNQSMQALLPQTKGLFSVK